MDVIGYLREMARRSTADLAEIIIALPWVADGVSDSEVRGIFYLLSTDIAESVIALPWLADGISDIEAEAIAQLNAQLNLIPFDDLAESVIAMPWLADGISDGEADFINGLGGLSYVSRSAAERIVALPWVADGVSDREAGITMALAYIANADVDAALQVMDMPFLQTPEAADMAALDTLALIAFNDKDLLADVLSRPMLKDGITDDEAPIVSMLYETLAYAPDRVDSLLDPDKTTVERRAVELPLAGEVDLVIVRAYPGAKRSMDLLENAVREAENLMGEPLPTRYVGLLYENALPPEAAGTNVVRHMTIRPEYDEDGGSASPRIIAHEVAHYYWGGNAGWLDEGMAELMDKAIENRRVGTPINPISVTDDLCEFARTIKESEALTDSGQRWRCSYPLGEGLFVSLLRTLGEDAFWEGARNLYASSRDPFGLSNARRMYYAIRRLLDDPAGIEEVRQAFGPEASDVIARWYGGR